MTLSVKPIGLGAAIALVALTGSLLVATPAAADTVFATVTKQDGALNVRSGPRLEYFAFAERQRGDRVALQCHTTGEEVGGSRKWMQIANSGFVPAVFLDWQGTTPECRYAAAPPRANPRTKDQAIDWQFRRLGSTAWEGQCLAFQRASFGWGSSGWATAEIGGDWIASHGFMHSGVPPRGALVWYHNSSGTGHVVVSIGNGEIIGTSVNGKVGIAGYLYHSGYRGWSVPHFPLAS